MVDPVKIVLSSVLINMENLVTVSHAVCVQVGLRRLGMP